VDVLVQAVGQHEQDFFVLRFDDEALGVRMAPARVGREVAFGVVEVEGDLRPAVIAGGDFEKDLLVRCVYEPDAGARPSAAP
jgi:hypothetical protein